jgi:DNA (cytosine-5)-methyltransferase 1
VTLKAIDLFSGAGGLSLGAKLAGIEVVSAIDADPNVARTYRANFPHVSFCEGDIRNFNPNDVVASGVDLILAGPPCQSFSTSNQKTRHDDNPLNNMIFEPLRFIRELRPRAAVIENVAGLGIGSRRAFLESLQAQIVSLGYVVTILRVSGSQAGLPQNRNRLFIVATLRPIGELNLPAGEQPTVLDAIADLPDVENGNDADVLPYPRPSHSPYSALLRGGLERCDGHTVTRNSELVVSRFAHVPPGGNWRDIPSEMMSTYLDVSRSHTGIYHRLAPDRPSKVIGNFRKNMLIHPSADRGLSIREAARLQSFPDNFGFHGSIGKRQQQVGNAVPPAMAAVVLRALIEGSM